jgi:hypothetical protein
VRRRDDELADEGRVPDLRDAAWYQAATAIAELRAEGTYAWAEPTLAALEDRIRETQIVTAEQRQALARITGTTWAPGRAYDVWGFGRRWR